MKKIALALILISGFTQAASVQKPAGKNCIFDQNNRYTIIQYKNAKRLKQPIVSIKRYGTVIPKNQHHLLTYGKLSATHEGTIGARFNKKTFGTIGATYEVCNIR
ncbi:hypothetical protein LMH73_009825 [Vibrio splendidus]|nr:hypothetical protein [Vibrio splendidus]MCC4883036.1 hypothetical protein [Vibrio splendidus]